MERELTPRRAECTERAVLTAMSQNPQAASVRRVRKLTGLSVQGFAATFRLPPTQLQAWEEGVLAPTDTVAQYLALIEEVLTGRRSALPFGEAVLTERARLRAIRAIEILCARGGLATASRQSPGEQAEVRRLLGELAEQALLMAEVRDNGARNHPSAWARLQTLAREAEALLEK